MNKSLPLRVDTARRRFLGMAGATAAGMLAGCQEAAAAKDGPQPTKCPDIPRPMKNVEGKVAFITGGSSGIGLGIARAFMEAGMKIAIGYRTQAHADEAMSQLTKAGGYVHALRVDVTDRRGMEAAAVEVSKVFGKIHVLVNNAGMQNPVGLSNMSYEDWDALMAVNVNGIFNGIRAFLPRIKQHGEGGQVITTASVVGLYTVPVGYGAYCASKFAAVAMMESLRAELSTDNIGVSVLCPGGVKSNLEKFLKDSKFAAEPYDIGRHVMRGMQRNDLYILTHPELNPFIQTRHEAIMASTQAEPRQSDALGARVQEALRESMYLRERDRYLCGS